MTEEMPGYSQEESPDSADANWLLSEETSLPPQKAKQEESPALLGGYDVEGGDDSEDDSQAAPVPPIPIAPAAEPKPRKSAEEKKAKKPPAVVEDVWSRGAEWGPTLVRVFGVLVGTAVLAYLLISGGAYALAFQTGLLGGLAALALSYPIFITLERPVRVTPEQAVKDYYAALSHLFPHYRRMWLLLSGTGRQEGGFHTFNDLQHYWVEQLASLRGGAHQKLNDLRFVVTDFRSEKSAGQSEVDGTYTVNVFRKSQDPTTPVASVKITGSFVRGPDRMWYLNQGKLGR